MDRNVLLNLPIVNQSSNYQLLGLACHQGKLWLKGILRGFRNPAEFLDHIATLLHWACCSWLCCNLEDCILHMQDFNTLPNCWNTELTKASSWLTLPEKKWIYNTNTWYILWLVCNILVQYTLNSSTHEKPLVIWQDYALRILYFGRVCWLINPLLIGSLIDWLVGWLYDWLNACLIFVCLFDRLINR